MFLDMLHVATSNMTRFYFILLINLIFNIISKDYSNSVTTEHFPHDSNHHTFIFQINLLLILVHIHYTLAYIYLWIEYIHRECISSVYIYISS